MPRRARDSSPASELKLLLERLLSDDNYMQAEKLINAMCGTAQDEPSDFTGKPTTGASNSRIAMDASSAGGQYQAIRAALALVEPHVGQIMAADSAAAVLREGLSRLGVRSARDVHSSALETMFRTAISSRRADAGANAGYLANGGSVATKSRAVNSSADFLKRNPGAARIRTV